MRETSIKPSSVRESDVHAWGARDSRRHNHGGSCELNADYLVGDQNLLQAGRVHPFGTRFEMIGGMVGPLGDESTL
jgi:hypothetical protein